MSDITEADKPAGEVSDTTISSGSSCGKSDGSESVPSAANVSHKDPERKGVGATAHGVASLRAWETDKGERGLIFDPYGHVLGGEPGFQWLNNGFPNKALVRDDFITGIALRTMKIDELIIKAMQDGYTQICVLGAGLDARPWRLHLERRVTHSESKDDIQYVPAAVSPFPATVTWFEVDFPEIFEFKHKTLEDANASLGCNYKAVRTDLSLPDWPVSLTSAGNIYAVFLSATS
jgi:O-methyltransferase involved in polyketide biosynthesis